MIRASGAIAIALLLLVSFALYNGVYRVKAQTRELKDLDGAITKEAEAIRVLKAEWSFLNQPERLQDLARRHLTLGPTGARQIVVLANLPERGSAGAAPASDTVAGEIEAGQLPFRAVPDDLKPARHKVFP
ncbi:MAG: hypothetical protein SGJ03_00855 [Alphaproteobacteria bacterium]|nr:hypothetical protein [Alphaproteobacteria bacterium]